VTIFVLQSYYKKEFEKNKAKNNQVFLLKDVQDISHAVEKQKQASKNSYKTDYKQNVSNNLPPDHPDFARARQSAMNASDIEYTKQKKEAIDTYRGFQTMDSRDHPVVQQASKASQLMSDATYKEGYNKGKDKNKYDVTTTEKYMAAKELENTSSDVKYKSAYEMNKDVQEISHAVSTQQQASKQVYKKDYKKNIVGRGPQDPVQAYPEHDQHRKATNLTSSVNYKNEYEKNKGKNQTSIPETHEMSLSKELQPVLSKKQYTQKSKDQQKNVHVGSGRPPLNDVQEISRAVSTQQQASKQVYKEDFNKNIVGKGPQDPAKSYPEYDLLREVSKQASKVKYKSAYEMNKGKNQTSIPETHEYKFAKELGNTSSDAEYVREADKMMHTHNLPLDYPEFVRAKENAKNASDKNYPDGLGPFHSVSETHEMERAKSLQPLKETVYSKEASTHNLPLDYPEFVRAKENAINASDTKYKKNHKETKALKTPEMVLSKSLRPIVSNKLYMDNFKKNVVGKAPADLTGSYPEYDHAREVSKMISKRKYKEDYMADKDIIYYPVHLTPGYEAAVKSNEHQSDVIYKGCQEKIGRLQ
uniref:SH3 domain-containing protein n=1 Tax=Ciona intestinalis TaxID=7719 RepID=H2XXK9_CIOIN